MDVCTGIQAHTLLSYRYFYFYKDGITQYILFCGYFLHIILQLAFYEAKINGEYNFTTCFDMPPYNVFNQSQFIVLRIIAVFVTEDTGQ